MAIFEPIFEALARHEVRYVVVGGVAVVLHGHARVTGDLDIAVDLAPDEARRAIDALLELGLRPSVPVDPRDFADPAVRSRWVAEKMMQVFSMRDPNDPLRQVDLFAEDRGFEGLWERAVQVRVGSGDVRVASIPDLIEMKRTAGRAQDLADIEALQQIAQLREGMDG
jgi:hypothetical protein